MKQDLDRLQGTWSIAALELDGQTVGAIGDARIVIKGSRFTSTGMGDEYAGTITVDSSVSPARIDMKFESGPEKGNTNPGIYQLDGDSWKLCLATRGTKRPAKFLSPPDSGIAVETLVRGKAAPKARKVKVEAPSGPATVFEGEWQMVSGVMNGVAMDTSTVQWVKRMTRGTRTSVIVGADLAAGRKPCAIVGTTGTTGTTALDPIDAMAGIARQYGLWLHVDAAME